MTEGQPAEMTGYDRPATGDPPDDRVLRVLVMCTANRCRSPMAAVIAADLLERRRVDAEVVSCGSMPGGVLASAGSIRAMRRRGLDVSMHLSQQIDADTVGAAHLIVTMERQHITTVAELSVQAVQRTFTLTEFADLATVVGPRPPSMPITAWIQGLDRMRHPSSVLAVSSDGDIADPMGGPSRAYRRTADEIESLLVTAIDLAFPEQHDR